ncbi:hypothetical protein K3740_08765 [Ruegeria conchae]|uniref:hypothetical protein n=1 Tax=Ruegeria conchae TaxID=981384 RepID=UPI0021A2D0BD|nr:hypothetical protein [Ruegeria conchae]UWR04752.1 hypothetical protein K3740_08765 [Ruegeria conchae]
MKPAAYLGIGLASLVWSVSETQAASWICHASDAAGYRLVGGNYRPQTFTADDRFLIRPFNPSVDPDPNYPFNENAPTYVGIELGTTDQYFYFWADFDTENGGYVESLVGVGSMQFYPTKNFLTVEYTMAAIVGNKGAEEDSYTPMFSIAKCARTD